MPLKSKSQQRLMFAVANDPKVASQTGIKPTVAKEFIEATPKPMFKKLREKIGIKK